MKTPAKCPQCGHRFIAVEATARAVYNLEALDRIKAGSSAAMLGWDEEFYRSICRKHGLEPVSSVSLAKSAPPPTPDKNPATPPAGSIIFYPAIREIHRGEKFAALTRRQADMLQAFIDRAPSGKPILGSDYAEAIGIAVSNVSSYVNMLRAAIDPVGLYVLGVMGRRIGGYMLVDQTTREPAVIHVVGDQ